MKRLKRIIRKIFLCRECGNFFSHPETCETCSQVDADMQTYSF